MVVLIGVALVDAAADLNLAHKTALQAACPVAAVVVVVEAQLIAALGALVLAANFVFGGSSDESARH